MINDSKFQGVLSRLLTKSKANQVNWQKRPRAEDTFSVEFKDGSEIVVFYRSPVSESDFAGAALEVRGETVYQLRAEDGDPRFTLLKDLYQDAYRSVTGWDVAIEQIDRELSSEDKIGELPPPF